METSLSCMKTVWTWSQQSEGTHPASEGSSSASQGMAHPEEPAHIPVEPVAKAQLPPWVGR